MDLTDFDLDMIKHAMHRGPVMVLYKGQRKPATLLCWRPMRHGQRTKMAKVIYTSGKHMSVRCEQVALPGGT